MAFNGQTKNICLSAVRNGKKDMTPENQMTRIDLDTLESQKKFETESRCNRWIKFPLVNGFVRLVVTPKNDIKISLATWPKIQENMIVISLGYEDNTKSSIGTIANPQTVEKTTKGILRRSCNEFWIIWVNGEIFILEAGKKTAFISMKYKSYPIHYIGFNSPNGKASWYLKDCEQIITPKSPRFAHHGIRDGYLEFAYKGESDCHIALLFMGGSISSPMCEVNLGAKSNTLSSIRVDNHDHGQVVEKTPNLVSDENFTVFCLQWKNGHITVRKDAPHGPIVIGSQGRCVDFVPQYFAVPSGHGVTGQWIFGVNNAKAIVEDKIEETK